MVQAGQDRDRSLFQTGHAAVDGGAQSEGDGHRLFVTEQQRRQLASAAQLIAPAHAGCGFDGVAEIAEPVDVAAHRPVCHVQPLGQLGARPRGSVLQQGQQRQHPAGTVAHEARRVIVAIPEGVARERDGYDDACRSAPPATDADAPTRQRRGAAESLPGPGHRVGVH